MIKQILCNPYPPAPPAAKPFPKLMIHGHSKSICFFVSSHYGTCLVAKGGSIVGGSYNNTVNFTDMNEPLTIQNV